MWENEINEARKVAGLNPVETGKSISPWQSAIDTARAEAGIGRSALQPKESVSEDTKYRMASPGEIYRGMVKPGIEAVARTPLAVIGGVASAIRGGSPEAIADKSSFLTRIIDTANEQQKELQEKYKNENVVLPLTKILPEGWGANIDTQTIARLPQQAGFSAVAGATGLAAGLGAAAVTTVGTGGAGAAAAPFTGRAAGMAASGAAAYRMQKDASAQQLYESLNEKSTKTLGRAMTPEEWKSAYAKNEGSLIEQGIAEALPEAIGNLGLFEVFFGGAVKTLGKKVAKAAIGKTLEKYGAVAAGKMLAAQAVEQATETWTQQWQHNIDVEMGLEPGKTKRSWTSLSDLAESNREVFADIFLLTAVTGGAGIAGGKVKDRIDEGKSAKLVKDAVAENKFTEIPNEFLPGLYKHAQELSDKRPGDKELAQARDAFTAEMDKRGIDYDMSFKLNEYLALNEKIKGEETTGDDVARWVELRDEFKEKNIDVEKYREYLVYQDNLKNLMKLYKQEKAGKGTPETKAEMDRLTELVQRQTEIFGDGRIPDIEEGGIIKKPEKPPVSDAKKVLLGNEPEAKKGTTTARSMLTEGDVDIQSEEELSPEAVQKIEETAAAKTAGTTGKRKKIAPPEPGEEAGATATGKPEEPGPTEGPGGGVVDITEHAKAEDVELFAKWDAKDEGAPKFVRARVEKLFAEKGEAGVNAEYKGEDNVSRYARYRLSRLTGTTEEGKEPGEAAAEKVPAKPKPTEPGGAAGAAAEITAKKEEAYAKTETEAAATGIEVAAGAERGGGAAAEGAGKPAARGAGAAEAGAAATAEEGEAEVKEKALTGDKAAEVGGAPGEGTLAEEGFRAWKANKAYIDNNGNYHVPLPGSKRGPIAKWNKAVKKLYPKHEDFQKASDEWALKASEEATAGGASGKPVTAGTTGKTTRKTMEPAQPVKAAEEPGAAAEPPKHEVRFHKSRKTGDKYIATVTEGPHKGVIGHSTNSKEQAVREMMRAIAEREKAGVPELKKEGEKNAAEEGKKPEGGVGEHPGAGGVGTAAEAGSGNRVEPGAAQPNEKGKAEAGEVAPQLGWEKNIFKARKYARALGVDFANKTLNQVVAGINAKLAEGKPAAAKEEGGLDLVVSGQAKPMPGREGVTYTVHKRKPDMIPHTFKVIVSKTEGGFLSEYGTGTTAREAYDKAVEAFDAKIAEREAPPAAKEKAAPAEGGPNWNYPPPEAWEKNLIKARAYAKALQVPYLPSSGADHALSLAELVNAVHEKLKQAPGAATEKPAEAPEGAPNWDFTPKDGWESHLLKAREYAIALKIPTTGISLEDLVANIKDKLKEAPETAAKGETAKEAGTGEEEKAAPGAAGEAREGATIDNEIEAASMDEISDMIDDAVAEKEAAEEPAAAEPEKPAEATPEKKTRTAGTTGRRTRTKAEVKTKSLEDVLADVASQGVTGAGEAITGLYELFGGSALKAGLGTFDEGTYAKAKPHFQASYEAFKTAGKSLKEYVKSVTDQLGRAVKPYLMKFIEELKTAAKELKEKVKAEREANKKNKFVDYGFVYDPYSMKDALRKAQVGTLEYNLQKTAGAVDRAKVFKIVKTEAMTPGTERYLQAIRNSITTFPEALCRNVFRIGKRYGRQSYLEKLHRHIEYDTHTLEEVTEAAAKYAADLSAFANYMNQSTDVANAQYRLVSYLFSKEAADKWAKGEIDLGDWGVYRTPNGVLGENNLSEAGKAMIPWTGYSYRGQYAHMLGLASAFKTTETTPTVEKKRMTRLRNTEVVRVGMDEVRPGNKDIESTDEYNKPFGFKGVAWGGYVEGAERQRLANASYDAWHDLAWVLGTTPHAVSIGGHMSVQFGNLGTANSHAAGLFFPQEDTMNLAKGSGDGCVAHEWGHGLDDILKNEFAIDEITSLKTALQHTYDYAEAEALVRRILDPSQSNEYERMVHKGKKGAELAKAVLIERWQATVMKESTFFEQCKKTSNAEYQKNREEMFARAFEAYVYDRLAERGSNNYLVNDWASDGFVSTANGYNGLIYPSGEERRLFNSYIKHFLDGIEWTDGVPRMKDDYVSILKAIEKESQAKLQELLDRIDTIYQEMFQGQKSEDGLYWYRFDEMSRGIGMQPLGYFAFNDTFKEEGQNGTGVVGYPEPIRAEEVVEFALKPILYSGEKTLTKEAKGGERSNERVGEEGVRGVEEEQAENVPGTSEKGVAEDGGAVGAGEDEGAGGGVGTGGMGPGVRTGRGTSDLDIAAEREGTEGPGAGPDALAGTGNFHITPEKFAVLGRRTLEDRFKDNIAALRVLKALEKEGRKPTPEEKDVLFRYSGWGGLGEATRRYASSGWEAKSRILHDLLTDEEINSLGDSSATAYYTPGEVVEGIYKAVARMGFKTGSVLDSATGTGNFIGIMPRDMEARANIRGIEPEMFSHKIAAYLYDSATITQGKLQDVKLPVNFFDLAVTNVPFADVVPSDKLNKKGLKLHDYFFIKNLHHVRPGGIVAMITTTGTMDSADQTARKEIAKVADFIGAIRLPEKLFSATDISTDIIFLQKRQHGAPVKEVAAWMEKTPVKMGYYGMTGSTEVGVNEYFKEHPEMVLGKMLAKDNRWGNVGVAVAGKEEGLAASLEAAIAKLPENIFTAETIDTTAKKEDLVPAPDHVKDHAFFEKDGKLFQNINAQAAPVPETLGSDKDYGRKIRLMIGMVQARRTVLRTQLDGLSDAEKDAARKELNRLYDAFVKKYGFVHDKAHDKVFVEDPDHPNVMALEIWDEEAKKGKKADIFREDVIPKYERQTKADNAVDALAITLNDRGHVDIKHIASLTGLSPEAIYAELKGRIFKDPESNSYVTREQYLSGNVVAKLETAREYLATDPDMDANIKALEAVRPPLLGPGDFSIRLGAPWIHPKYVKDFMTGLMEVNERRMKLHVSHNAMLGSWHIQPGRGERYRGKFADGLPGGSDSEAQREFRALKSSVLATSTWGTADKNFIDLMECALNNRRPIVTRKDPVTEKSYTDIPATEAANAKLREIYAEFQRWALADPVRAKEITDLYNHDVNNMAVIECDGSHLTLPGKNIVYPAPTKDRPKGLYHTQLNAVWRYLTFGNSYFAHDMGTGKTITLATTAMEAKRLGLKKKPMILTFTNVVEQFRDEFQRLYPTANLLVLKLGKDPLKNKELLARVSTNNWDCVIMSQTSFDHIRLSPEAEAGFIQEELEEYRAELSRVQADEGGSNKKSKKQSEIANAIARMEERLKKVLTVDEKERSQHLFFEELGVDLVLVDEAHTYKNVPFATKVGNIKFINPRGAATSQLFEFKMRYLNNTYRAPNGRPNAVVLASGTPLTNSVGELFNIQKILQPDLMRENNLHRFDAWASSFGEIGEIREPKPAGIGYKMSTAFRRFINVPELKRLAYQVLDVVSSEDVGLTRPDLETGAPINVRVAQNEYVTAYQNIIQQRADEVEANPKEAEYRGVRDNLLRLVLDGRKVAIDQRLVGDYADTEEQPDSKVAQAADKIVEIYHKTKKEKGVQLVFADLGVPKRYSKFKEKTEAELEQMSEEQISDYQLAMVEASETKWNTYDGMKEALVKRGIPANEIAFIQDAEHSNPETKKKRLRELFRKTNKGTVRILMGTTKKLGTGANIQERVKAIHHLDVWWNYSSYAQRNARGWRTGNTYKEISIYNYVTENTVDQFVWNKVFEKGRILACLMSKDMVEREIEDLTPDQITARLAASMGDPMRERESELIVKNDKLRGQYNVFMNDRNVQQRKLAWLTDSLTTGTEELKRKFNQRTAFWKIDAVQFAGDSEVYSIERDGGKIAEKVQAALKRIGDDIFRESSTNRPIATLGWHEDIGKGKEKTRNFNAMPYTLALKRPTVYLGFGEGQAPLNFVVRGPDGDTERTFAHWKTKTGEKGTTFSGLEMSESVAQAMSHMERGLTTRIESLQNDIERAEKESPRIRKELEKEFDDTELRAVEQELKNVREELYTRDKKASAGDKAREEHEDAAAAINKYYIKQEGAYVEVKGIPVAFNGYEDMEFFAYKRAGENGKWTITERSTGRSMLSADTKAEAIEKTREALNNSVAANVKRNIKTYRDEEGGSTPWWQAKQAQEQSKEQYSLREGRGGMPTLEDVQKIFAGQEVRQLQSGAIAIQTRGGHTLVVKTVESITPDRISLRIGYGKTKLKPGQAITGAYISDKTTHGFTAGTIELNRLHGDTWTLAHESVHFMEDAGILSQFDVITLKGHIKGLVKAGKFEPKNRNDIGGAEDRAEFLAQQLTAKAKPTGAIGNIVARIRNFIDKLANAFGKRTVGGIVRDIESGRIYERHGEGASARGAAGAKYSTGTMQRTQGIPAVAGRIITSYYNSKKMKAHPDYDAAKAGDWAAAERLVVDLVKPETIAAAKERFGADAIYVAPHAIEATGKNAIPNALAHLYAERTGATSDAGIIQGVRAFHTGAGAMDRMISRVMFDGDVVKGGKYVLVDDVTTLGGTFAELAHHIQANGGTVAGVITLTNASRSGIITANQQVIDEIERRFGNEVRELFGIDPKSLTATEARYLNGFRDADTLRNRAVKARQERQQRLLSKGIRQSEEKPITSYQIEAFEGGAADILNSPEGRFSTKYIGTGTNSTAFGWGLYFTSRAEVAKMYADLAAKRKGTHKQKDSHHLYGVTLHKGKTPDQYDYLRWDERLTERQAMKIRNRLQASGQTTALNKKAMQAALFDGTGAQTYETLTDMLGSKEAASRWLLKAGIDGTTWRADYVMDNVPEGTRNYVVFDDKAVQIEQHRQYRVVDLFRQTRPNDPVRSGSLFKDVDARLKEARGIKTAKLKDRARDTLLEGFQHFTRHFQHLDPKKDGAIIDVLRQFQEVPAWAKEETANRLVDFVGKLTPNGREVFTMNILLPDMLRDIDSGLLDPTSEEGLPFGYKDRAQVEEDLDNFKAKMTPEIERALDKRNAFMKDLTDQLIEHKLLNKELANNPDAYFHHQVLAYMNYKDNPSWGVSSGDVRTHRKGWQLSRKGSRLDYNTEYVESEFEVVSQALAQIETVKTLKEVERLADIKKQLTGEARQKNMAEFRRWVAENVPPGEDPLKPFKTKMAIGFAKLTKAIENGDINVPPEFEDVAEHFVEQAGARGDVAERIVPHPKTFAFLSWLVNHSQAGAMPAAMVFKGIAQRNQFIRKAVGDKWVTYRNLVPEGYVVHKPEASSTFYFANTITDRVVEQVVSGQRALADTDLRKVLARGKDAEWVIPEGVSKTLDEFRPAKADSLPGRMSKDLLSTWKQWVLMNPFRVLKYNVNNMSGDMDICMAYDPKIITQYMVPAFKELWAQYQGAASGKLKEEMSALARKGLIGSGMTAMDIPELNKVGSTKALVDFMDGRSKGALMWWWSQSKKLSTLRENVLRLAAYRYFTDQLKTRTDVYGASRKAEIDAIADRDDRAVKLARELIGDYGNISHAGQYLRERIIPFYSWIEINAPRYVRLFRNLKHEGGSMTGMAGTMAWKATKLGLKACALMALVALWNGAMFPDEEEELQETGREQLHLILGRRADGSIITLRFQGALSDALSWFGMDNPFETAKRISKGRMSGKDVGKEVVTAAPKKLFQGLRPEPKLLYEVVSGQSYFPDPTRPRPIRDTTEHIARVFSLDRVYNRLAGKPIKGGDWSEQLRSDIQGLLLAESDPGEQAYYTARKYVFEWLDKSGKEKPVSMPTNRSNALYYYKQALRFGDFEAAARYLAKYKELGGKESNVSQSIKRAAPLASLKLADRYQFKQSLTAEQQQTLKVALDWYKVHYVGGRREEVERRAAG